MTSLLEEYEKALGWCKHYDDENDNRLDDQYRKLFENLLVRMGDGSNSMTELFLTSCLFHGSHSLWLTQGNASKYYQSFSKVLCDWFNLQTEMFKEGEASTKTAFDILMQDEEEDQSPVLGDIPTQYDNDFSESVPLPVSDQVTQTLCKVCCNGMVS